MPHDNKEEKEKTEQQNFPNTKYTNFSVTGNIASLSENKTKPGQPDFSQVFNKLCKQNNIYSFNQKVDFYVENQKMMRETINSKEKFGRTIKFGKTKNMSVDLTKLPGAINSINNAFNYKENRELLITTPNSVFGLKKKLTNKIVYRLF